MRTRMKKNKKQIKQEQEPIEAEVEELVEQDTPDSNTDNPLLPEVFVNSEVRSLSEELATAILGRMQEADTLHLKFLQSGLTHKEKLDALIEFKASMVIPSLRQALGLPYEEEAVFGSFSVIKVLESIEDSIRSVISYEDNEQIDFSHPKIVESYRMLFEILVEVLTEEIKDPIIINNFIEKSATRCVNIEHEFNKTFKRLSNKMASYAKNPITQSFVNRKTDSHIASKRLLDECLFAKKTLKDLPELDQLISKLSESNTGNT